MVEALVAPVLAVTVITGSLEVVGVGAARPDLLQAEHDPRWVSEHDPRWVSSARSALTGCRWPWD